ncbi:MAG: low specificity L-threonine aldolase, partial [Croceicoccus sp.]|nr:low specificity L-threonine aldolase [Croceicoccus sp.]
PERLLDQVDANEVFMRLSAAERESLRSQGFAFYDWSDTSARFVTAWNTSAEDADALAKALAAL